MELLENCYEAYRRASDDISRRFNQALFVRILVDQDGEIRTELAEPFEMILSTDVVRPITNTAQKEETPIGISLVEGSRDELLVRVLHNYSKDCVIGINPGELLSLARADQRKDEPGRRTPKSARQLRYVEIDRLVARYREVRNVRAVAVEFKLSRTTVTKHLADRGIVTTKSMNAVQIAQATELYADGLSSVKIGKQLGFDNHTILKKLRSNGVPIRHALGR